MAAGAPGREAPGSAHPQYRVRPGEPVIPTYNTGSNTMCYAIYGALIFLFALYSDTLIEEYALSASVDEGQWIQVARGWEIVAHLWPLLVLTLVVSSAVTYLVTRRILAGGK